jgi:hypothetical protein
MDAIGKGINSVPMMLVEGRFMILADARNPG